MFCCCFHHLHRTEVITGELVSDEQEAASHHQAIERKRVAMERVMCPPPLEADQNRRQCEPLTDFHSDIEADDVGDEPVLRQREVLQLGGKTEAVEQAEDEHRGLRIRLESEETPEPVHVLEG